MLGTNQPICKFGYIASSLSGEHEVARFFDSLDPIRALVKKSNDNKASKKTKDLLFDEASGALKDTMEELMAFRSKNAS